MPNELLPFALIESIKYQLGYKEERAHVCENCKHFVVKADGFYEGEKEHFCGIVKEIGIIPVIPGGTCSKFSRNPAP